MNDYSLRLAKPHCDECHQSKTDKNSNDEIYQAQPHESSREEINNYSLAQRLEQTIKQAQQEEEDEL